MTDACGPRGQKKSPDSGIIIVYKINTLGVKTQFAGREIKVCLRYSVGLKND